MLNAFPTWIQYVGTDRVHLIIQQVFSLAHVFLSISVSMRFCGTSIKSLIFLLAAHP